MRDLKFRAWIKKDREMVYYYPLTLTEDYNQLACQPLNSEFGAKDWIDTWTTEPSEDVFLMQYTGLKDKKGKGKECYHKDIANVGEGYIGDHREKGGNFLVEWGEDGDGWILVDARGEYLCDLWEAIYCRSLNVIGNIYENPELLEKKHLERLPDPEYMGKKPD